MKHPIFDVFGKYQEFEIIQVIGNTVTLESQVIPFGASRGYKYKVMFNFEKVEDFNYEESKDGTKAVFTIDDAKIQWFEVDRTKNESKSL